MRTFKFRFWDTIDKEFVDLDFIEEFPENFRFSYDGTLTIDSVPKDRYIIQQWTGITDKEGNDIFEGDIVLLIEYHQNYISGEYENELAEVVYKGSCWNYKIENKYDTLAGYIDLETKDDYCKIIGNIFQNPEYLK